MRRRSLGPLATAGLAISAFVSCDTPRSALPTAPSALVSSGVEISGPESVAPGQVVQFSAVVRLADGTVKTVAPGTRVTWQSSNSNILRVDSTGLVTGGQQRGDATLSVDAPVGPNAAIRRSTRQIAVLPEGTFRVIGTVTDAEYPSVRLAEARVEVTPGSLVVNTDSQGVYRLYGVPAAATIQVTKTNYQSVVDNVQLTGHATRNVSMTPLFQRLRISGNYRLAIDIIGGCSSSRPLPADLRSRQYDVAITQNGLAVDVVLTEPRFRLNSIGRGNRFTGAANVGGVSFRIDPFDFYYPYYGPPSYPSLVEALSDGTVLVVAGAVNTTGSAAGLTGSFNGSMQTFDQRFPIPAIETSWCFSPMTLSLTPR